MSRFYSHLQPGYGTSGGTTPRLLLGAFGLLLAALLAGCGASTTALQTHTRPTPTPTATATLVPSLTATIAATAAGDCPDKVMGTATVPPAPAPTPIAAANWTTYINTSFSYSIQYPASWYAPDLSPASNDFSLLNFDPHTYHPGGDDLPPPPYTKIEVLTLQDTAGKTPMEVYAAGYTNNPLAAPECSRTVTQMAVAGHAALQIVQWPAAPGYGPPTTYPQVFYYVVAGNGRPLLALSEAYSPGGQPSPTFARMIASLTFTA